MAFLHLKRTVRGSRRALRARSPELARQEAWALLLAHNLIAHGADPRLPTAVVSRGTCEDQEVVHAPLAELGEASRGLATPALLVLGHVVELAALLAPLQPLAEAAVT